MHNEHTSSNVRTADWTVGEFFLAWHAEPVPTGNKRHLTLRHLTDRTHILERDFLLVVLSRLELRAHIRMQRRQIFEPYIIRVAMLPRASGSRRSRRRTHSARWPLELLAFRGALFE